MYPSCAWTTLHPVSHDPSSLVRARAAWARASKVPAGLWTVELSPRTKNLHCNIIHPLGYDAEILQAHRWTQPIDGQIRAVAAYISKREQFPDRAQFAGRIYGTLGPLWSHLASAKQEPVIAAASVQVALDPGAARVRVSNPRPTANGAAMPSREEARIIAERYLPSLLRPRVRI